MFKDELTPGCRAHQSYPTCNVFQTNQNVEHDDGDGNHGNHEDQMDQNDVVTSTNTCNETGIRRDNHDTNQ